MTHERSQAIALEALQQPRTYPHATDDIRVIETHISKVFLTGPFAYKVKRAVKLPFVDFSSLQRREHACREELRLNRRLAPSLYLDVVSIGGDPESPRVGGEPALEYAVRMIQFPPGATAQELVSDGTLTAAELADLGERIAAFHLSLSESSAGNTADDIRQNLAELQAATDSPACNDVGEIGDWLGAALQRLAPLLERRAADGFIRECHGDLHLGNIVRWEGRLLPFDCLEFSTALRTIDVFDEACFLFMDLLARQRQDLAFAFLNPYLGATGDYPALRLIRLFAAHRALVRAKVALATPRRLPLPHTHREATGYLAAALAQARAHKPVCVITVGFSGSGKTTVTRRLASRLGAVHVRSDVERKRLHGMRRLEDSRSAVARGIYSPNSSEATYRRLAAAADAALAGAMSIIVDASFLQRRQRDLLRSTAESRDARWLILACEAPVDVLRRRIMERARAGNDASEADLSVLEHQQATADAIDDDERAMVLALDTGNEIDVDRLAETIRSRFRQPSLSSTSY